MAVFNVGVLRKAKGLEDPERKILISSGDIDTDISEEARDLTEAALKGVVDSEKLEKFKSKKEVISYGKALGVQVPDTLKLVEMKEYVKKEAK